MLNHEINIPYSVKSIPNGGLADRIRNLLVSIKLAKINNTNVICHWIIDSHCNGFFDDYFEPIPNVEFKKEMPIQESMDFTVTGSGLDWIEKSPVWVMNVGWVDFEGTWNNQYSHLIRPIPRIQAIIDDFVEVHRLKQRIGLHIRRTDWLSYFNQCLEDTNNDLLNFINLPIHRDAFYFLASDNEHSQLDLANLLGDRLVIYKPITKLGRTFNDELRQTSLEHAIIDLFLLSYCETIFGTSIQVQGPNGSYQLTSGFTILAKELKRLNNAAK